MLSVLQVLSMYFLLKFYYKKSGQSVISKETGVYFVICA